MNICQKPPKLELRISIPVTKTEWLNGVKALWPQKGILFGAGCLGAWQTIPEGLSITFVVEEGRHSPLASPPSWVSGVPGPPHMLSSHFAITATWRCVAFILQGCRRDPRAGRGVTQQYRFTDRWGRVQGCVSSPAMGLTLVLGFRAEQMVRGWGSAPKTLCLSLRPLLENLM